MKRITRKATKREAADMVFQPLYTLINELMNEEVSEIDGTIVVNCTATVRTYADASLFIRIWCATFQKLALGVNASLNVTALPHLAERLQDDQIVITEELIQNAYQEINMMRDLWCKLPDSFIQKSLRNWSPSKYNEQS